MEEEVEPVSADGSVSGDLRVRAPVSTKSLIRRSPIVLCIFFVAYAALGVLNAGKWAAALQQVSVPTIVVSVALVVAGVSIRALRWCFYTSELNWQVPLVDRVICFVAGFAFTATPGKAGEIIKGVLLRRKYPVSLSETAGILVVERLGDLLALVVFAAAGLWWFSDIKIYAVAGALLIVVVIFLLARPGGLSSFRLPARFRGASERITEALRAGRRLLDPAPVAVGVVTALLAWSCEGTAFHLMLASFGIQNNLLLSFAIYGISALAGALSMLPGGLGSAEVVMVLLLDRVGVPTPTALAVTVAFRLLSIWLFTFIGMLFTAYWTFYLTRRAPQEFEQLDVSA